MEWRAKTAALSSDQGLRQLQETHANRKKQVSISFGISCVLMCVVVAAMWLASEERIKVKVPTAIVVFATTFAGCLIYFFCLQNRGKMDHAVIDLTSKFELDIDQVVTSQIKLRNLDDSAKVLIVVYATSLLKNLLVKTFQLKD